jgi:hypothetical protein
VASNDDHLGGIFGESKMSNEVLSSFVLFPKSSTSDEAGTGHPFPCLLLVFPRRQKPLTDLLLLHLTLNGCNLT